MRDVLAYKSAGAKQGNFRSLQSVEIEAGMLAGSCVRSLLREHQKEVHELRLRVVVKVEVMG